MKEYLREIAICTIVAAVATLLFYIIGLDKTAQEAATTFGTCFLVMFVLGMWNRMKRKN
jgi:hypothetical protein